ncbi:hypothetical protein [Streptomyces sp. NPDC048442]|uniref:hypothetical protein n=1 Tax=Streptomyces sp. NPDC048442 TaxID=3154823 RepID=UPI003434C374
MSGELHMQLNGMGGPAGPPLPGGGPGVFGSKPSEKAAAAKTIETELQPNTKKATEHADEATTTAAKGFKGWDTAAGLKKVADTWDQQVKSLMGRLVSERAALRSTSGLFVSTDIGTGDKFPLLRDSKLNGL